MGKSQVHIPCSGHENRPPHLYARSNCQLKEGEDMGAPTEEQTLPGQEISDNYSCHNQIRGGKEREEVEGILRHPLRKQE